MRKAGAINGGRVYEKLVDNDELYSEACLIVPAPEFYVLYNGAKPFPERETYLLSDSFAATPGLPGPQAGGMKPLELVVEAYNINRYLKLTQN